MYIHTPDSSSWPLKAICKHLRHNKLTDLQTYIPLIKEFRLQFIYQTQLENTCWIGSWKNNSNGKFVTKNRCISKLDLKSIGSWEEETTIVYQKGFYKERWTNMLLLFTRRRRKKHSNVKFLPSMALQIHKPDKILRADSALPPHLLGLKRWHICCLFTRRKNI